MAETFGTRAFLGAVREIVRGIGGQDARDLGERESFQFVQFHLGDPRLHYEVWVQKRQRQIEVGLHLEADKATNQRLLSELLAQEDSLRERLGLHISFEQWTPTWTRLHETIPAPVLDVELAELAAVRVLEYLAATRSIVSREALQSAAF